MHDRVVILGHSGSVHIIRWVRGLVSRGYDIHVISCGSSEIPGIRTTILGSKIGTLNSVRFLREARREISKSRPKLIHAFHATGYALWGAADYGCPKILTPLGSDILIFPEKSIVHKYFVKHCIRSYDRFTTASDYLKDALNRLSPESYRKTSVIPFGVVVPDRSKPHKENSQVRLIFMKMLKNIYGPHILLEALVLLRQNGINIKLDIYGNGPEEGKLQKMAEKLNISDMVAFKGWLQLDKITDIYFNYDIMVMPSLSESFGVAALEASSAGLPVVASNVGGIPEVVRDGLTGILTPPGDPSRLAEAIMKLASDVELRKKMGAAGRKYVAENFQWANCLDRMAELYERLIKGRG